MTFLVNVADENCCRVLPETLARSQPGNGRVKVRGFPPLGIQTLTPVLRQRGHEVRLFDTAHPQMKAVHIAEAARRDQPGVIALSFHWGWEGRADAVGIDQLSLLRQAGCNFLAFGVEAGTQGVCATG